MPRALVGADWKRPPREWFQAKTQFAVMFKERFVLAWRKTASHTKIPAVASSGTRALTSLAWPRSPAWVGGWL
jgi:hypothetical protein